MKRPFTRTEFHLSDTLLILYPFLLAAAYYFVWFYDLGIYGLAFVPVALGICLIFCKDVYPTIPFFFLFVQGINKTYTNEFSTALYGFCLLFFVASFVIHFIRFRTDAKKPSFFLLACALFLIALGFSGFFFPDKDEYLQKILLGLCVLYGLLLLLFSHYFTAEKNKRAVKLILLSVVASSLLATAQFLTVLQQSENLYLTLTHKNLMDIGYANSNQIANLIARIVPICFYFASGRKKISVLWLIPATAFTLFILLTMAKATILVLLVVYVLCFIVFFIVSPNKLFYLLSFIVCVCGVVALYYLLPYSKELIGTLVDKGFDDNGRFALWKEGIALFQENFLFGTGFGYNFGKMHPDTPYWYHNTVVQTLACSGVIGTAGLGIYLFTQHISLLYTKNVTVYAVWFVLLLIQGIALLDIHFYTPQEFIQMTVMTCACLPCLYTQRKIPKKIKIPKKKVLWYE